MILCKKTVKNSLPQTLKFSYYIREQSKFLPTGRSLLSVIPQVTFMLNFQRSEKKV